MSYNLPACAHTIVQMHNLPVGEVKLVAWIPGHSFYILASTNSHATEDRGESTSDFLLMLML